MHGASGVIRWVSGDVYHFGFGWVRGFGLGLRTWGQGLKVSDEGSGFRCIRLGSASGFASRDFCRFL